MATPGMSKAESFFSQMAQPAEKGPDHLRVVKVGRQCHQSANAHIGQCRDAAYQFFESRFLCAGLAFFFAEIDLDEDVGRITGFAPLPIDFPCQRQAVDGVNHGDFFAQIFDLVRLQAADEVPFDLGHDLLRLGQKFLHIIFTEQRLAGGPAASSIMAVGFVLDTATSRTSRGLRPMRRQAASMRSRISRRLASMLMKSPSVDRPAQVSGAGGRFRMAGRDGRNGGRRTRTGVSHQAFRV